MAWTYEQNFNDLNTADLNGQDSWSGASALLNVVTDQTYEGAKAVKYNSTSTNMHYTRSITSVTSGTFYFAQRSSSTSLTQSMFSLRNAAGGAVGTIGFYPTGDIKMRDETPPAFVDVGDFVANTWYVFEVVFNTTTGKYKARWHNESSWSDYTAEYDLKNTDAITSISLGADANAGGGSIWWDIITPTDPVVAVSSVKTLVVGGGGGGGTSSYGGSGGGGAGGYQYNAALAVTTQAYSITVGEGGASHTNGSNSVFSTITATGGGRGGDYNTSVGENGANGGSGGGGGSSLNTGTDGVGGTGSQGFDGGTSAKSGSYPAGSGGGGAGAVGANGVLDTSAGDGGVGIANSITGSSVYYAGGGGGARWQDAGGTNGAGGVGGGGAGLNEATGEAGTANTGGGGGGGATGGEGGSGVVIMSFATDGSDGVSTSSTGGTITTSGDQTIHTFTSNGTFTVVLVGGASSNNAPMFGCNF